MGRSVVLDSTTAARDRWPRLVPSEAMDSKGESLCDKLT
jgi:hypothetical protein